MRVVDPSHCCATCTTKRCQYWTRTFIRIIFMLCNSQLIVLFFNEMVYNICEGNILHVDIPQLSGVPALNIQKLYV